MEPAEYSVLYEQEESFWWYRGLRRLVEERIAEITNATGARGGAGAEMSAGAAADAAASAAARILDAGCGTGGMLLRLRRSGPAFGIDYSPLALERASRRGEFRLVRGSVTSLPYRSGSFGCIVSLDVLYHRGVVREIDALREFRRCLRPGGTLVLNLPAYEHLRSSHDEAIHTARRYRREGVRALLEEAGLQPVRLTYWNTLLFPGLALVRLARRRASGPPGNAGESRGSDVVPLPRPVNRVLEGVLGLERRWLRHRDLPFGLSLLAIARRPVETP